MNKLESQSQLELENYLWSQLKFKFYVWWYIGNQTQERFDTTLLIQLRQQLKTQLWEQLRDNFQVVRTWGNK